MLFVGTAIGVTHPVGQFGWGEQAIRINHSPLAMNPLWLNGIEPRTLGRKRADHDAYPLSVLPHPAVVLSDPAFNQPADMLGGIVPH